MESDFVPEVSKQHIELEANRTNQKSVGKGGDRMIFYESHWKSHSQNHQYEGILHEGDPLLLESIQECVRIHSDEDSIENKQKSLENQQQNTKYFEVFLLDSTLALEQASDIVHT